MKGTPLYSLARQRMVIGRGSGIIVSLLFAGKEGIVAVNTRPAQQPVSPYRKKALPITPSAPANKKSSV